MVPWRLDICQRSNSQRTDRELEPNSVMHTPITCQWNRSARKSTQSYHKFPRKIRNPTKLPPISDHLPTIVRTHNLVCAANTTSQSTPDGLGTMISRTPISKACKITCQTLHETIASQRVKAWTYLEQMEGDRCAPKLIPRPFLLKWSSGLSS